MTFDKDGLILKKACFTNKTSLEVVVMFDVVKKEDFR